MNKDKQLILTGKLLPGFDLANTIAIAKERLKLSDHHLEIVFTQLSSLTIKKEISEEEAFKYQQALHNIGIHSIIEDMNIATNSHNNNTQKPTAAKQQKASSRYNRLSYLNCLSIFYILLFFSISLIPLGIFSGFIEPHQPMTQKIVSIVALAIGGIALIVNIRGTLFRLHDLNWHGIFALFLVLPILSMPLLIVASQTQANQYGEVPEKRSTLYNALSILLGLFALALFPHTLLMYVFLRVAIG